MSAHASKTNEQFATYTLDQRGFLTVRVLSDAPNDLARAHEGVRAIQELANCKHYPLLIDLTNSKKGDLTHDARAYYIEKSPAYATRIAIVTSSTLSRVLGNLF